jgi:hypothetical protein
VLVVACRIRQRVAIYRHGVDDIRDQLRTASTRYVKTGRAHDAAQVALMAVVAAALLEGVSPTEVVELSRFSAAYVRRIARENGIPPAKLGRKPRSSQQ